MDAQKLLETRWDDWQELERLLAELRPRKARRGEAAKVLRLGRLYRNACADLALADAYRLPDRTVEFLRDLVSRAHAQFYGSRPVQWNLWIGRALLEVPRRLHGDRFLRFAALLFFGVFLVSGFVARWDPEIARSILGEELLEQVEWMHGSREPGRDSEVSAAMTGFYIQHNISIGLQCFAWGLFFGLGTVYCLFTNALILGLIFGYIATTDAAAPFYDFVTAHAPFELTAIVLAGAAGLRLGFSLIAPGGWIRRASLQRAGRECVPLLVVCVVLFALAAVIEAYVSPSRLPFWVKGTVALLSVAFLGVYFVAGRPGRNRRERDEHTAPHP